MPARFTVKDLTPNFLRFYELAQGADPDRRWGLWQEHYGFAAVPPTPQGQQMARAQLDQCWERYPGALPVIRAGAAGVRPDPQSVLAQVSALLDLQDDLELRLVLFVGMFDGNAFQAKVGGVNAVNIPVEQAEADRALILPHEFAHALHDHLCGFAGGYQRSIGMQMMMEGIAIHTAMTVAPGRPEAAYLEFEAGWLERCKASDRAILTGIRPYLRDDSLETLTRFVFGSGSAGLNRESYYAGYRAVDHLLERRTLAELARLREADFIPLLEETLVELAG